MRFWHALSGWYFRRVALGFLQAECNRQMAIAIEAGKRSAIERKAVMQTLLRESDFPPDWSIDLLMSGQDPKAIALVLFRTWEHHQ
jgi:hypothetical protein